MDIVEIKSLFSEYKEVKFFPSPEYRSLLNNTLCSTTCLFEEENGQNTRFTDLELITYFFNLPCANFQELTKKVDKFLVEEARGHDETTVGTRLEQLLQKGHKITHIVRSTEEYGGDTHYSVWREYMKAEIYEVGKNG